VEQIHEMKQPKREWFDANEPAKPNAIPHAADPSPAIRRIGQSRDIKPTHRVWLDGNGPRVANQVPPNKPTGWDKPAK